MFIRTVGLYSKLKHDCATRQRRSFWWLNLQIEEWGKDKYWCLLTKYTHILYCIVLCIDLRRRFILQLHILKKAQTVGGSVLFLLNWIHETKIGMAVTLTRKSLSFCVKWWSWMTANNPRLILAVKMIFSVTAAEKSSNLQPHTACSNKSRYNAIKLGDSILFLVVKAYKYRTFTCRESLSGIKLFSMISACSCYTWYSLAHFLCKSDPTQLSLKMKWHTVWATEHILLVWLQNSLQMLHLTILVCTYDLIPLVTKKLNTLSVLLSSRLHH